MTSKEWVKNELSLSYDCLTTHDRIMLNKVLQDLELLEELKKENQELKTKADKYDELCSHNVLESQSFGDDLIMVILDQSKQINSRNKKLAQENQKLAETLELYNEKFVGYERVKADLIKENQELKQKVKTYEKLLHTEEEVLEDGNMD